MNSCSFFTHDGELVFIKNADDLANLVESKISYEAAQLVRDLAEKATREAAIADTDLRSYESELSELQAAIRDLDRKPEVLVTISNKQRINSADKWELRRLAEMIRRLLSLAS